MEFYHDPYADEIIVKVIDYICSWIEWAEIKWYTQSPEQNSTSSLKQPSEWTSKQSYVLDSETSLQDSSI